MIYRLLMAGLLVLGGWHLGHGAYLMAKAELAQWLLDRAWQEMQNQAQQSEGSWQSIPPWPWADTFPMAKLRWHNQAQEMVILEGASGRNLAFGPAHMSATVQPGQPGVSVIGGHRDTHFEFLQHVLLGDEFSIESINGDHYRFQVKEIIIADVRESKIPLQSSVAKVVLVACYPFDDWQAGSPLRYLVVADLIMIEKNRKVELDPPTSGQLLTTMSV